MIKYTPEGLLTDEPVVKAMHYQFDKKILRQGGQVFSVFALLANVEFTIPWPAVREAYQPVEGEGYIYDSGEGLSSVPLTIAQGYGREVCTAWPGHFYHKSILNIVTTRRELRELIKYAEKESEKDD